MELELFKCRASAAGKLMTNPKNKADLLSQTTKSFVQEWLKQQIYGYRKELTNKEVNKGIIFEDIAIDKAIEWLDLPFAIKNTERFTDEFFTGEPDLLLHDEVIDIKNSWDCFTFPLFDKEIPTDDYFYQVQVYMYLTGKKKARVVYILLETPETYNQPEWKYDHVDKKYRIKEFRFDFEPEIIEKLKERIINIRNYINELSA
ncbi:MAG TPA: hypothetical protein VN182_06720 [Flavobacterium sp.]|nr:hypothetical protein [Flavobacterium sp.]